MQYLSGHARVVTLSLCKCDVDSRLHGLYLCDYRSYGPYLGMECPQALLMLAPLHDRFSDTGCSSHIEEFEALVLRLDPSVGPGTQQGDVGVEIPAPSLWHSHMVFSALHDILWFRDTLCRCVGTLGVVAVNLYHFSLLLF